MNRYLLSSLTLSLLAAFAHAAEPATPAAPVSGIDVQYIDPAVRVQDDFFSHLNGKWLATAEIPADKSSWGSFAKLRDDTTPQLRGIIEATQQDKNKKAGSEAQKIGDLYASYMDEARLDALGVKPLAGELNRIRSLRDKKGVPGLIAHLSQTGVSTPYAFYVGQDARESTKYAAYVSQSGLGMPDRDYYLEPKQAEVKAKYQAHVEKMLAMAGDKNAAAHAKAVVALETSLAEVQWTKVENRDPVKRYNKTAVAKLNELTPGYDLKSSLAAAGIANKVDYVIVNQPSYLAGYSKVLAAAELDTVKAYFEWQLLRAYAPYLSKNFVDTSFDFYGTVLSGVKENQPRWKRGVGAVDNVLGEAVGKLYVAQYFPAERKEHMQGLIAHLSKTGVATP